LREQPIESLSAIESDWVRYRFISEFVDRDSRGFVRLAAASHWTEQGLEYEQGYLWDCLSASQDDVVSERQALLEISTREWWLAFRDGRRFTDREEIGWPDVALSTVVRAPSGWIIENHAIRLPEDLYLVADDLSVTVILTHETMSSEERMCFRLHASNLESPT
jgi:hypothetical protein